MEWKTVALGGSTFCIFNTSSAQLLGLNLIFRISLSPLDQSWAIAVFFVGLKKIKSTYFFKKYYLLPALVLFKKPTSSQINYS